MTGNRKRAKDENEGTGRAFLIWCSGNGTCKTRANCDNGCYVLSFLHTTSEVYPKDSS